MITKEQTEFLNEAAVAFREIMTERSTYILQKALVDCYALQNDGSFQITMSPEEFNRVVMMSLKSNGEGPVKAFMTEMRSIEEENHKPWLHCIADSLGKLLLKHVNEFSGKIEELSKIDKFVMQIEAEQKQLDVLRAQFSAAAAAFGIEHEASKSYMKRVQDQVAKINAMLAQAAEMVKNIKPSK